MDVEITCRLFLSATNVRAAEKIINKVIAQLYQENDLKSIQTTANHCLQIIIEGESWEACILKTMILCQSIGYEWALTGSILHEICLWSTKLKISGIKAIDISCEKYTLS